MMAFISDLSAEMRDLPTPIVIGCKRDVAERFLALPKNQILHLASLPPSFHAGSTHPDTNDSIYFALPVQSRHPGEGYVFSRSASNADFQLPQEAPPTTSVVEFRIIINERLEWTLVDESVTGTTVNGMNLHSAKNQSFLASTGYRLSNPVTQIQLHTEQANAIRVGWGALHFELYILHKPTDYHYHPFAQPNPSIHLSQAPSQTSQSPSQFSQNIAGTHMLRTTEDIDAELHRQTGGDLTKGLCIDPARFPKAANPCQPSVVGSAGGGVDMAVDDEDWTVLAGLGQLNLRGEDDGFDAMES